MLEDVFGQIAAIPDEVFDQGEDATREWLKKNSHLVARDVEEKREVEERGVEGLEAGIEKRQGWIAIAKW